MRCVARAGHRQLHRALEPVEPNPILVVGNTADPATPYANAVKMIAELRRARLLTVKGYGHTDLLNPSACANRYISLYLLRDALPPAHTVCSQNRPPFTR